MPENHENHEDYPRIRADAYGRYIEPDDEPDEPIGYPDLSDDDPDHRTGFFVEVRTSRRPLTDREIEVLKDAIFHICHDNLGYDSAHGDDLVVKVHEAPVLKDGPNPWEETL